MNTYIIAQVNNFISSKCEIKIEATSKSTIRLKGQMKWIDSWNMIAFLCHPVYVQSLLLLLWLLFFYHHFNDETNRLSTTDDMLNIGLTLHDLNFYDGSSEILIAGMQHAKQLQTAIDKVCFFFDWLERDKTKWTDYFVFIHRLKQHEWISRLQATQIELKEWRRKGKRLLYSMMPRHIAYMLQEGVLPNSICEVSYWRAFSFFFIDWNEWSWVVY